MNYMWLNLAMVVLGITILRLLFKVKYSKAFKSFITVWMVLYAIFFVNIVAMYPRGFIEVKGTTLEDVKMSFIAFLATVASYYLTSKLKK